MISFLICLAALIAGYFLYGKFVDRVFGPDPARVTPAVEKNDGIDYVPMPTWKVFMIQFLNIAGTGPIFGAIMGAKFGPASYLWIVLGSIFAGAVHDYFTGMLSIRHGGASLPDIVGEYLGKGTRAVMLVFSIVLLMLVGTVFVFSPAQILGDLTVGEWCGGNLTTAVMIWVGVVFAYYIVATLLPVDKVIGKIYPLFAFSLLFMAIALMVCLFIKWPSIPELWDGLGNMGPSVGVKGQAIFPCLFITIACGAISGFHATQSPIMARCLKDERLGRPVFYGAMITEGIVALIWAAVSSYFFFDGGAEAAGSTVGASAPQVVTAISRDWLGILGGILAILGVVAAPITSGDTAFRSARLIIADFCRLDQAPRRNRLIIALPVFAATALLLWYNISDAQGFNTIWNYFGWANQTLACFTLWAATAYLSRRCGGARPGGGREAGASGPGAGRPYYLMTLLPACFMTAVCVTFICVSKQVGFHLPDSLIPYLAVGTFIVALFLFYFLRGRRRRRDQQL